MRKHVPTTKKAQRKERKRRHRDAREIGKRRIRTLERYREGKAYTSWPKMPWGRFA